LLAFVEFDVIVNPKRTNGFKWIVNIEEATLEGLKNSIREMNLGLPALENDGAVLNFTYKVKDTRLRTIKTLAKCSNSSYQRIISNLSCP